MVGVGPEIAPVTHPRNVHCSDTSDSECPRPPLSPDATDGPDVRTQTLINIYNIHAIQIWELKARLRAWGRSTRESAGSGRLVKGRGPRQLQYSEQENDDVAGTRDPI